MDRIHSTDLYLWKQTTLLLTKKRSFLALRFCPMSKLEYAEATWFSSAIIQSKVNINKLEHKGRPWVIYILLIYVDIQSMGFYNNQKVSLYQIE